MSGKFPDFEPRADGVFSVVVLCGGAGTRLKSLVTDRPKALADIGGIPFMDLLLEYISRQSPRHIYLCAGILGEQLSTRYSGQGSKITVVVEERPLGTGGAVKHIVDNISTEWTVICNGDTYVNLDLKKLLARANDLDGLTVIATSRKEYLATDVGVLTFDGARVTGLARGNKGVGENVAVSLGFYIIRTQELRKVLAHFRKIFSLESDMLPLMIKRDRVSCILENVQMFDIGTPDRYDRFKNRIRKCKDL